MSTPHAGWYPDPSPAAPPSSLRWWDGAQWTGHARPGDATAAPGRTGPTTDDGQRLAGWWWRVLAVLVDSVGVGVVGYVATLPVQQDMQRETAASQQRMLERLERGEAVTMTDLWTPVIDVYRDHVALVLLSVVLAVAYYVGFLRWRGATPGKLLCGLRVRPRAVDGRLSWSRIAPRVAVQLGLGWLVLPVAIATGSIAVFIVGQLVAFLFYVIDSLTAVGQRRQTIHDRAAGTVVVTTR